MFKVAKNIIRLHYRYTLVSGAVLLCALSSVGCGGGSTIEPSAAFSATPTSGEAPLSVQFTDASSGATGWSWDFDNDGTADSTSQNPQHIYDTAGTHTVKLAVTGDGGSDDETKTGYITVTAPAASPAAPSANFTATPASGEAPLSVQFSDTTTGDVTSWSWDFDNDGTADSTVQNPVHLYNTADTYTVKLTVTGLGGSDTESKYVDVTAPSTLSAGFTFTPTSGDAPLSVQFTDTSTGGATTWSWDFDNDGTADSTAQNPQHTYNTAGSYYIKQNIENAAGTKAHMIQQITITEPVVPYVFDPNWWQDERLVWYYGQPLGSGQQQYYDAMAQTGVRAASWLDIRFTENWEDTIGQIVTRCHNNGIAVVGTISMITTYQEQAPEPTALQAAILVDPFGNQVTESGFGFKIYSTLHPALQDYLVDCLERTIDLGVDGLLIDELPYGAVFETDFNPNTMTMFSTYLRDIYTLEQLNAKIAPTVVEDWDSFDYADYVVDRLAELDPPITGSLSRQQWGNNKDGIKFNKDFDRFLRFKHKEAMADIITQAKAYALSKGKADFSVSGNLSDLFAPEAQYAIDLLDYVNLEWHYMDHTFFPVGRAFSTVKLAEAFGKMSTVLTDMPTRANIRDTLGVEGSTTLYMTMIADACASGGAFHLEQGGHQLVQDLTALAPYYNFVPDNPGLFNGLALAEDDIGVLYQWERADIYNARAYRGVCNLLADTGYQFETIFGAEDYTWWGELTPYPAPPQTLAKTDLDPYSLVIIPELNDITPNHADILLQYVNGGGKAIIFATSQDTIDLDNHRGGNTYIDQLIVHLDAGTAIVGSGKIIRITDIWGTDYLPNLTAGLKTDLETALTNEELEPTVDLVSSPRAVSAFAYKATGKQVVHLVNYNYNAGAYTTAAVSSLELDIDIGELSETGLTVTYYTPEEPEGAVVPGVTVSDGVASVTVPELNIWGVLVMEN
ncbi:PKD domain-containing protein [Chloroflexota bacterium]